MQKWLSGGALAVFFYLIIPFGFGGSSYVLSTITAALVIGGVALAWALIRNLGGMISFGHSAFFGVGAYVSALLSMNAGMPPLLAMIVGGLAAALSAFVMFPALRLTGAYFALAILAYAEIFRIIAIEWRSVTNGSSGLLSVPELGVPAILGWSAGVWNYLVLVVILTVFLIVYARIRNSDYGLALRAMHDSETATRVIGVNSTWLKVLMLLVSAFMTGVIGAFNVHMVNFLDPDYGFGGTWVVLPIVAAIFGGYKTIWGPIVGALVIYVADQLIFKSILPYGHQLVVGAALVAMIIASPEGLVPLVLRGTRARAASAQKG